MGQVATEGTVGRTRLRPRPRVTLAARLLLGSVVLAFMVAGVFLVLLSSISGLREATEREARSKDVTAATLVLEKLVVDLETGLRGLALTRRESFLQPWKEAKAALPERLATFQRLAAIEPDQERRAERLANQIRSYVFDYTEPLVAIARVNPLAATSEEADGEGKKRTDRIRTGFADFLARENELAESSAKTASERADRALVIASVGVLLSALLIVSFGFYLARAIGGPLRAAADGARRLAGGEQSVRVPERGPGEVGELTRSFNSMAADIERGREELQEQNARLRESERLKSELVSIVSHEVRTPLASVLGFTSLLLHRELDPATQRHYLEIIDAQGRRLASLLDDFLDVQRLEEGRLELAHQPVDLNALLREQAQLFSALSERHRLEVNLPDDGLTVLGDSNRLAQVLGNLLSNAIKYSPEGGVVELAARRRGNRVRISVSDEGLGIPPEQQPRIFTKFFRGDAAASGISGSGLGLAFARAVVEAHGGELRFTSTPGDGSTFWLELPATGTPARSRDRAADAKGG